MTAAAEQPIVPRLSLVSENEEAQMLAEGATQALDIFRGWVRAQRFTWWQLGGACQFIKKHEIWRNVQPSLFDSGVERMPDDKAKKEPEAFHSYNDFVQRNVQKGKSTIYRAVQLREELSILSEEDANRISLVNAMELLTLKKRLGESKWCSPKTIEAAIRMSEEKFEEFCDELKPGAAKDEKAASLIFRNVPNSLMRLAQKALKVALWEMEEEDGSELDALEALISSYLNSPCEIEKYSKLTKLEAHTRTRGRRGAR